MEMLVAWLVFAGLIAWWASQWSRRAGIWFLIAALFSPLIAGIALAVSGRSGRPCPVCGRSVPAGRTTCAQCGHDFAAAATR